MAILLVVTADSVAVLEIDAEVFHRLALQLLLDPAVDDLGDAGIDSDRFREGGGVRRVLRERLEGEVSELSGRVALEQVRAAVDRVHGLAGPGLARVVAREIFLLCFQAGAEVAESLIGEGGLRHAPSLSTLPQRGIPSGASLASDGRFPGPCRSRLCSAPEPAHEVKLGRDLMVAVRVRFARWREREVDPGHVGHARHVWRRKFAPR